MTSEEAKNKICPKTFYWQKELTYPDMLRFEFCQGNNCMAWQLKFINDENSGFYKLLEGEMK